MHRNLFAHRAIPLILNTISREPPRYQPSDTPSLTNLEPHNQEGPCKILFSFARVTEQNSGDPRQLSIQFPQEQGKKVTGRLDGALGSQGQWRDADCESSSPGVPTFPGLRRASGHDRGQKICSPILQQTKLSPVHINRLGSLRGQLEGGPRLETQLSEGLRTTQLLSCSC